MSFRSPKLLRSAKDQPCVLCGSVGTTIAAHANSVALGKGTGIKCPDFYVAFVCQRHHDELDGRVGSLNRSERWELWVTAYLATVKRWFEESIVIVK